MLEFIIDAGWRAAVYPALSLYTLWLFYLAVMTLLRARAAGTLTPVAYRLALPMVALGITIDVLVNIFVMTALMLELPKWRRNPAARFGVEVEWTVTARLSRHIHDGAGWRQAIALWMGANLLDQFDPSGKHLH
jgi:hypothetical protein